MTSAHLSFHTVCSCNSPFNFSYFLQAMRDKSTSVTTTSSAFPSFHNSSKHRSDCRWNDMLLTAASQATSALYYFLQSNTFHIGQDRQWGRKTLLWCLFFFSSQHSRFHLGICDVPWKHIVVCYMCGSNILIRCTLPTQPPLTGCYWFAAWTVTVSSFRHYRCWPHAPIWEAFGNWFIFNSITF